jgi:outer membrane protein assembly factor BamE (lipoprotein component of BamABCDE complex)
MKPSLRRFFLSAVVGLLIAVAFSACTTTEHRISKNPDLFNRLTPEQQTMIKEGKVGLGFDKDMVYLAVGEPDRKITRTEASGSTEIWSYTTWESPDGVLLYRGGYHSRFRWGYDPFPYYLSAPSRRSREYFRVVFKDDKVVTVEAETR